MIFLAAILVPVAIGFLRSSKRCPVCGRRFSTKERMWLHLDRSHAG